MASEPSSPESTAWWQRPQYALPFAFLWPLAILGGMVSATHIIIKNCAYLAGDYGSEWLFNLIVAVLAYLPSLLAVFFLKWKGARKKLLWFVYLVFVPVSYAVGIFALFTFGIGCIT